MIPSLSTSDEAKLMELAEISSVRPFSKYYLAEFDPTTKREKITGLYEHEFYIVRDMAAKESLSLDDFVFSRGLSYPHLLMVLEGKIGPYLGGPLKLPVARSFTPEGEIDTQFVKGIKILALKKLPEEQSSYLNATQDIDPSLTKIERNENDYSISAEYRRMLRNCSLAETREDPSP